MKKSIWNTKLGLLFRWIFFAPAAYLLFYLGYLTVSFPLVLLLNTNLHWYFKSGILLFLFLPTATFVVFGVFSLGFFMMPNTFICGLILGIPFTIFTSMDLVKVFAGKDTGNIGLVPYSILQIFFILIFWVSWLLFIIFKDPEKPKECQTRIEKMKNDPRFRKLIELQKKKWLNLWKLSRLLSK